MYLKDFDGKDNQLSEKQLFLKHMSDNPHVSGQIEKLGKHFLLRSDTLLNIIFYSWNDQVVKVLIGALISLREDKKYKEIKGHELEHTLVRLKADPIGVLDYLQDFQHKKILTPENAPVIYQAMLATTGAVHRPMNEYDAITQLSRLNKLGVLDDKNVTRVCKIIISNPQRAKMFLDCFEMQFSKDVAKNKQDLEKWLDLYVQDKQIPWSVVSEIIKAFNRLSEISITFLDIQDLVKEKPEVIMHICETLHLLLKAIYIRPSLINGYGYYQENLFEKIRTNIDAMEKSIKSIKEFSYEANIEFIFKYPEYTQLDSFKVVLDVLEKSGIAGISSREYLQTIFDMPYVEATLDGLAGYFLLGWKGLEESELIIDFMMPLKYRDRNNIVGRFDKTKMLDVKGISDLECSTHNDKLFHELIELFQKASEVQAPLARKFGMIGSMVSFVRANPGPVERSAIPLVSKGGAIYSFLAKPHPILELDERIRNQVHALKKRLIDNKNRRLDLTEEGELILLINEMNQKLAKLESENLNVPVSQRKTAIEMIEQKIPIISSYLDLLLLELDIVGEITLRVGLYERYIKDLQKLLNMLERLIESKYEDREVLRKMTDEKNRPQTQKEHAMAEALKRKYKISPPKDDKSGTAAQGTGDVKDTLTNTAVKTMFPKSVTFEKTITSEIEKFKQIISEKVQPDSKNIETRIDKMLDELREIAQDSKIELKPRVEKMEGKVREIFNALIGVIRVDKQDESVMKQTRVYLKLLKLQIERPIAELRKQVDDKVQAERLSRGGNWNQI